MHSSSLLLTIEKVLQTYSLEELLELNELTEIDAVEVLVRHGYVDLPDPRPVDV